MALVISLVNIRNFYIYLVVICLLSVAVISPNASDFANMGFDKVDPVVSKCTLTPFLFLSRSPQNTGESNNLIRKSGSPETAKGKVILIRGRVFDKNCIPITNATVEIWHANNLGIYQTDKRMLSNEDSSKDKASKNDELKDWKKEISADKEFDMNFAGSGKAFTDNLGFYQFVTIYPGFTATSRVKVPYINFRVTHRDFLVFTTKMYFPEMDNTIDSDFKKMSLQKQKLLIGKKIMVEDLYAYTSNRDPGLDDWVAKVDDIQYDVYNFDVTLGSSSPYKSD